MSQTGDLSEEDQARSKKLADAWIRQDKASECSKLLQVRFQILIFVGPRMKLHLSFFNITGQKRLPCWIDVRKS